MKVGIVAPFSWSFWGGVVDHVDHQARTLHDLGVDAKIIIGNDPPGRLTRMLHPRPGRHDEPPPHVLPVGRTVMVPANASLANIVLTPQAMGRMRQIFRKERFDVVHVHEPFAPILSAYAIAIAECPVVVTCHSSGGKWFPVGRAIWGRLLCEGIDHRIAVSEQARKAAAPNVQGEFELIPNGVELPSTPTLGGREHRVVFVGRHEPRKGLQVLLKAWPAIADRSGARLRLIGADPLAVRLLMRRFGVKSDAIDVLGVLPAKELQRELRTAKVLVAPAVGAESFGIVLAQAFACGTPVVASAISGYTEVANDRTGILVPPGDADALQDAAVGILADERRRQELGRAGRARAEERYDWRVIGRRLLSIYELLTGVRASIPIPTT